MTNLDRFNLPKRWQNQLDNLTEGQIMVLGWLCRLQAMYPENKWFDVYKSDIKAIVNCHDSSGFIHYSLLGTEGLLKVADTSTYKTTIKLKRAEGDQFTYVIKHLRNVVLWSYILGQGDLTEIEKPNEYTIKHTAPESYEGQLKKYLKETYPRFGYQAEVKRRKIL